MLKLTDLRRIFDFNKGSKRFFLWAVIGLAFSQSVIVSTVGLMNGFEKAIKESINVYLPDINISHRFGLAFSKEDLTTFQQITPSSFVFNYNILDGFILKSNEKSSAARNFELPSSEISKKFNVRLKDEDEVIIGTGLAKKLGLKEGEEITYLSQGKDQKSLGFSRKRITKIIDFPIYEQSQRYIFSLLDDEKKFSNHLGVSLVNSSAEEISDLVNEFEASADFNYRIRPFWSDYKFLLQAVEVEKKSISLILQVIVLVAIFNVVAFLLYFKEMNLRKIFLLSSFGMAKKTRINAWRKLIIIVWSSSTVTSLGFVFIFDLALKYLPVFKLPAKIYYMKRLSIKWSLVDFSIIYVISFFILFLITNFFIYKMEQGPILKSLREEFN